MNYAAFDTLEFADTLRKAGIPRDQAEAISRASQKAFGQIVERNELATKADLEIGLANLRADLIRWVIGSNIALGAFLAAVMAWLK